MALSLKAVIYGVLDPTFASRVAAETVTTAEQWTLEEKEQIVAVRVALADKLAAEVNRIEAQLSLMVSHLEGEQESVVARLKREKRYVPAVLGLVVGVVVTLIVALIR